MKLRTKFRRIGITGSARSGKTVFLMSLISHLKAGELTLPMGGKNVTTSRFKWVSSNGRGIFKSNKNEFDYDRMIGHLSRNKEWPQKTTDNFFYRCRFERSDCCMTTTEIEFFDFPGERVADVTMIGKSFEEWSATMLKVFADEPGKMIHASHFLETINSDSLVEIDILDAYKIALARLIANNQPLISPSTFMLDNKGLVMTAEDAAEIIAGRTASLTTPRFSGLQDAEFAPLPLSKNPNRPAIYKNFSANYKRYQTEVVNPFARNLLGCHNLIFLIDIADVLMSGDQKYNDIHMLIEELLTYIETGISFFGKLGREVIDLAVNICGQKCGWIDRIAFIASKADKVHALDRDKLVPLLRDLAKQSIKNSPLSKKGKAEFFNCISVLSTESSNNHMLVGRPIWEYAGQNYQKLSPEGERQAFPVTTLPGEWPNRWDGTEYSFYDFYPIIPAVKGKCAKQSGLEHILAFALED